MNYTEAKQYLARHGQEHLLHFYDTLTPPQQESLLAQIAGLGLERPQFRDRNALTQKRGEFAPLGALTIEEIRKNEAKYREIGLRAIREAKVGAVLLAGGQGSRLGFEHPKGMFNMGRTRELYIFQCLIENLKRVTDEAQAYVPLLIMTSKQNNEETQAFFREHGYFGYSADNIDFFTQETEPAVDEDGKILMTAPDQIALLPNGNGGWFSSMQRAGLLEKVHSIGIEWLNVFAVDNVLQQIADPVFLGATIDSGCASGGKVVSKATPDERVGVLCLEDGKPSIVEYFEMTDEMRTLRNPDGSLAYRFGVILNYLFRVDALTHTLNSDFPLYVAHKKIAHINADGVLVKPDKPNGYKFETLVLDMVHMQDSCLAFEVDRSREFAPVKNATGVDSVETAQALLEQNGVTLELHRNNRRRKFLRRYAGELPPLFTLCVFPQLHGALHSLPEQKAHQRAGKEQLPAQRHGEIEGSGLEPYGDDLSAGVPEQNGGCEAHQRTHPQHGHHRDRQHQMKRVLFLRIHQLHRLALGELSHQKKVQHKRQHRHNRQFAQRHEKDTVLHTAGAEGDVVADHGINHHQNHHSGENNFLYLVFGHKNILL